MSVERFRDLVRLRLGLEHDDGRLPDLGKVMASRLAATGAPDLEAYARIAAGRDELRALAEQLTVGETYFFRNADHIRALADHVLPERLRLAATSRRLRVLSLGCASGEEPYSLAILIREQLPTLEGWGIELVGVDVNAGALARAAAARYSTWSLRATPAERVARWFRAEGREHVLDPSVRSMVRFVEHNLADASAPWATGIGAGWDVVLCRNVLMYLSPALAASVIERIGRSLAPGGYLFLGHAETLRGRDRGFGLCHTHDTFYYQRGDDDVRVTAAATGVAWVDEIDRASRRIADLHAAPPSTDRPGPPPPPPLADGLAQARSLFEQERLDAALSALDALPVDLAAAPAALLLRAVVCVNSGRVTEAHDACTRLLDRGVAEPGAHYVMALCSAGDDAAARAHHLAALDLDAGFAMSRLHLGLLDRRAGDAEGARRELATALGLLEREGAQRLALFGGGFGRAALLALCAAELRASGGGG